MGRALILNAKELGVMKRVFWVFPWALPFQKISSRCPEIEPDELRAVLKDMEEKGAIRQNKRLSRKHGEPAYRRMISRWLYKELQRFACGYGSFPLDTYDELDDNSYDELDAFINSIDKKD